MAALLSRAQQHGLGRRRFRGWRGRALRRKAALVAACAAVGSTVAWSAWWFTNYSNTRVDDQEAVARRIEGDWRSGFGEVHNALGAATNNEFFFLHQDIDPWSREMEAIERDVSRLEASSLIGP
jgi:hypothetical protein